MLGDYRAHACNSDSRLSLHLVSRHLQGIVKVGAVDADQHKALGGQYGVRGFPTIKIFGANKNKPEEYQGTAKNQTKGNCLPHYRRHYY